MIKLHSPHTPLLALTVALLSGCGGTDTPESDAAGGAARAEAAEPLAREPLTEADLAGLSLADLSVEVPWMRNRVSRDPGAAAARSGVMEAATTSREAFDRVLFRFTDSAPFPGYAIEIVDAATTLPCGGEQHALDLGAERTLVIRLTPARTEGDGLGTAGRTADTGATRFARAGTVCAASDQIVWAAGVTQGEQVRVLELRNPQRLAVDVR